MSGYYRDLSIRNVLAIMLPGTDSNIRVIFEFYDHVVSLACYLKRLKKAYINQEYSGDHAL